MVEPARLDGGFITGVVSVALCVVSGRSGLLVGSPFSPFPFPLFPLGKGESARPILGGLRAPVPRCGPAPPGFGAALAPGALRSRWGYWPSSYPPKASAARAIPQG